jgi:hypothetical protein
MGCYEGITASNHYGADPVVTTAFEVVSDVGQSKPLHVAAATTVAVSSSHAEDKSDGTGARSILITGLDANYDVLTEVVVPTGLTDAITTGLFLRINQAQILSSGTGLTNAGDIYVRDDAGSQSSGVPDDIDEVFEKIRAGFGISESSIFSVPRGFTFFASNIEVFGGGGSTITFQGHVWLQAIDSNVIVFEGVLDDYEADIARTSMVSIPQKSTVWIEAKTTTGSSEITAILDGILVENAKYGL